MKNLLLVALVLMTCALAGCQKPRKPLTPEQARVFQSITARTDGSAQLSPSVPALSWRTVNHGQVADAHLHGGREADRLWLFRPLLAPGQTVPCIVMAPAGTRLFHGNLLGETPEHDAYLKAGFAVVACEIDGPIDETKPETDAMVVDAARKFQSASAGIRNMQEALDVAEKLPWVNKKRIFVAGHSSAATLALQTAAFEQDRIAGCIACAPEVNVSQRLAPALPTIEAAGVPGLSSTLTTLSPHNLIDRLDKPVFLFCAKDDSVVSEASIAQFAESVKKHNSHVTYQTVPTGDHFDAMLQNGIPLASDWVKQQ